MYFFVDPPHVLKTVRNCVANSHAHRKTRDMWKDGKAISWQAIEALYQICLENLYTTIKLTKAHIKLTSFSCMKVIYAAQVFSQSVYDALIVHKEELKERGHDIEELAELVRLMNRWFDCYNAHADEFGKRNKEIDDLKPYSTADDPRFKFLKEEFLGFLDSWEKSVKARPGHFKNETRERMMISQQSLESLRINVYSLQDVVAFMLGKGATSVDSRKFSQDKLEQYFGLLRMSGGSSSNPDLKTVLQKGVSLHAQGSAAVAKRKGNTQAERGSIQVDQSPLPMAPKRKKK